MKILDNNNYKSKWFKSIDSSKTINIALCFISVEATTTSLSLASISAYLKKYNSNLNIKLFSIYPTIKEEKYSPIGFTEYLNDWQPDVIAISVMTTQWDLLKAYLKQIKSKINKAIVIGGYQPTLRIEETLGNEHVDFICTADGEIPMNNLLKLLRGEKNEPVEGLLEKANNNSYYETNKIQIKNLNELPYLDYDIFLKDNKLKIIPFYFDYHGQTVLPVITGRGCHFSCTYCSNSTIRGLWPNKKEFIRKFDIDFLIKTFKQIILKYKVDRFEFWDELFIDNSKFVYEFLEKYKKEIHLPFSATARVEYLNKDITKLLSEAKCEAIYFGLESGDEEYRKKYLNRYMSNKQIEDAADNCRNNNIKFYTFNMLGMPFETKENMIKTIELNRKINPDFLFFSVYTPLHNTKMYDLCKENDLIIDIKPDPFKEYGKDGLDYILNIKEHKEGINNKDFNEICYKMYNLQQNL